MQNRFLRRVMFKWVWVLPVLALAACGGGGGSSSSSGGSSAATAPPAATSLSWAATSVKQFHFSWTDVATASEYRLLENPDATSGYSQVASIAPGTQAYDLGVFLPARVNASYILEACNALGCTDSAPVYVSGNLATAVGYVKASNTDASDNFGFSVALSTDGNTMAVGAIGEGSNATGINGDQTDNSAKGSGAVYVFIRGLLGIWSQQAYVKASNTGAYNYFGMPVALSADGNTLAVGATSESSNAIGIGGDQTNNGAEYSGAVYLFTRTSVSWTQQAYVKAPNTDAYDYFGNYLALSADAGTLAVTAYGEDSKATGVGGNQADNSVISSGAVYLY